jgi:hypothetical protein
MHVFISEEYRSSTAASGQRPAAVEDDDAVRIIRIETIQIRKHPMGLWVQLYTDAGIGGLGKTDYEPEVVAAAIHDFSALY